MTVQKNPEEAKEAHSKTQVTPADLALIQIAV